MFALLFSKQKGTIYSEKTPAAMLARKKTKI